MSLRADDGSVHRFVNQEEIGVEPLKVALLGCGVVGTEVARLLTRDADELSRRAGAPIELVGIGVRRLGRGRGLDLPAELFTTDVGRWSRTPTSSSR